MRAIGRMVGPTKGFIVLAARACRFWTPTTRKSQRTAQQTPWLLAHMKSTSPSPCQKLASIRPMARACPESVPVKQLELQAEAMV